MSLLELIIKGNYGTMYKHLHTCSSNIEILHEINRQTSILFLND